MSKKRSVGLILILMFSSIMVFDADAHSMFNSAEKFEAGFRVQVATVPEFPQIDEPSKFLIRVTDEGFEEIDRFTMGVRVFYNDQQIDAIPPKSIEGAHWDIDYVWKNSGNHIVKIDLYDTGEDRGVTTYTFNMGTQNPFGYIFFIAIIIGVCCLAVVVAYIYLPKKIKKFRL